jgi:hypothetical protein
MNRIEIDDNSTGESIKRIFEIENNAVYQDYIFLRKEDLKWGLILNALENNWAKEIES